MKKISRSYLLLPITITICILIMSFQDSTTHSSSSELIKMDTVPEIKGGIDTKEFDKAMIDLKLELQKVAKEIQKNDVQKILNELQTSVAKLDLHKMQEEIKRSLNEVDIQKIRSDVEKELKGVTSEKINEQINKALNEATESIEKSLREMKKSK